MKKSTVLFFFTILCTQCFIVNAQPGTLDQTFGAGGLSYIEPVFTHYELRDIAVRKDGKMIALSPYAFTLLDANGSPDLSFGDGGTLIPDDGFEYIAIELDSMERIVVMGIGYQ